MSLFVEFLVELDFGLGDLNRIIDSAPARYKSYAIRKRSGGLRQIAQPARELKALQYHLMHRYLNKFPVHDIATAYVTGSSIVDNARTHLQSEFILKLDFVSFFNSLTPKDWRRTFVSNPNIFAGVDDYPITEKVLFWGVGGRKARCLSIGAPSSPILSNIMLFNLDTLINEMASSLGVHVTRYADDITVSAQSADPLLHFERSLARLLEKSKSPILRLNHKKRGLYSRGEKRMVTGLILTPNGLLSAGRERKRKAAALIHRFTLGVLTEKQTLEARGLVTFIESVEPGFISKMIAKYGDAPISSFLKHRVSEDALTFVGGPTPFDD